MTWVQLNPAEESVWSAAAGPQEAPPSNQSAFSPPHRVEQTQASSRQVCSEVVDVPPRVVNSGASCLTCPCVCQCTFVCDTSPPRSSEMPTAGQQGRMCRSTNTKNYQCCFLVLVLVLVFVFVFYLPFDWQPPESRRSMVTSGETLIS